MRNKRTETEAAILVLINAYRHVEGYTNEQIAEFIGSTLELNGLFRPPKAVASADALEAAAGAPGETETRLTLKNLSISAWADDDEDYGVDLRCEACCQVLDQVDDWSLPDIVDLAERHNQDRHA